MDIDLIRHKAIELYEKANIILSDEEKKNIELVDFNLNDFYTTGLSIVTYVNTERCCAKELALFPGQTCPEHRHGPIPEKKYPGKEETFRCRYGKVYLYVEGDAAASPTCKAPAGKESSYTVWHEIVLEPGQQFTLMPNIKHWFQAGENGAIISEFSTKSYDEFDIFTDADIVRV